MHRPRFLGSILAHMALALNSASVTTQSRRNSHSIGPGRFDCSRKTGRNLYQRRDGRIPDSVPGGARRRLQREVVAALKAA